jgi:6-pyruvoyltetrahydropterin/6-carboxytetrahydropterin synthase
MKTCVIRRATFNAAHRLHSTKLSDQENKDYYGLCNLPNYHGHNYVLEVKLIGEIDPDTGYVFDLKTLKEIIEEEVIEPYDHRNLNLDVEDFKHLIPTAENIAMKIYDNIRRRLDNKFDLRIKLAETENNIVEYPAINY